MFQQSLLPTTRRDETIVWLRQLFRLEQAFGNEIDRIAMTRKTFGSGRDFAAVMDGGEKAPSHPPHKGEGDRDPPVLSDTGQEPDAAPDADVSGQAIASSVSDAMGQAAATGRLPPCGGDGRQARGGLAPPATALPRWRIGPHLLTDAELLAASRDWRILARPEQQPPANGWRTWLLMGGRGSGKTRAGAEWVHGLARRAAGLRMALVAETLADAREVMIDGQSGIMQIAGRERPVFEISRRRLVWPNGSIAYLFSSEDPESLRGPQFHAAWCDELAKWKHAEATFDMLQFGLRLGDDPRQLVTTTPRPLPLLKRLMADPGTALTRISTSANAGNLAPGFIAALEARYGGTRLGRQELDGELIEDREDAFWRRDAIPVASLGDIGPLTRIVVGVDPPVGHGTTSCCGIVVAGMDGKGRAVVLADCSVEAATPAGWALAVARAYRRFEADRVIAEINQGGDMVVSTLRGIDENLPITTVRASRGKVARAEPVAALYEQGRVTHAGRFVSLEDQMCDFGPGGLSSGRSPDRLDAMVWALTALMLEGHGEPRVRGV